MSYQEITFKILELCKEGDRLLYEINTDQKSCNTENKPVIFEKTNNAVNDWATHCINVLEENGFYIESQQFRNNPDITMMRTGWSRELSNAYYYIKDRKDFLLKLAQSIETQKTGKELVRCPLKSFIN